MFYKSKFGSFQIFGAIGFKWTLVRSSYPFVLNFGMAMETDEKTWNDLFGNDLKISGRLISAFSVPNGLLSALVTPWF